MKRRTLAETGALLTEVARVLLSVRTVERALRSSGPGPLLDRLRRRGRRQRARAPAARERLRTAISWVDARWPGRSSCYRRALLEVALDRGAASEPFRIGIGTENGSPRGHAWLGSASGEDAPYDAQLVL